MSHSCCPLPQKKDWFFRFSFAIVLFSYIGAITSEFVVYPHYVQSFFHSIFMLMNTMSWGIGVGIVFIGLLGFVPREAVIAIVGSPNTKTGIIRATLAGVLLDLCSHGILMVGLKFYERGVSLAQVMAFLIASPWNSFSLTLILVSLIGVPLTFSFVLLSALIALSTGFMVRALVLKRILPANPNTVTLPQHYLPFTHLRSAFSGQLSTLSFYTTLIKNGFRDGRMVLRWILFGTVLASLVRTLIPDDLFSGLLGPTLGGLGLTLFVATILEVCSEGSTPLAADLVTRAHAPGNAFAFLMTGVSTDYTEILALRDATQSWKATLALRFSQYPKL